MREPGIRERHARATARRAPVVDEAAHVLGILTERDLLDALPALLRERVVRPGPVTGEPGGTYNPGIEPPPPADPWQNTAALARRGEAAARRAKEERQ